MTEGIVGLLVPALRKLRRIEVHQTLATQTNEGAPGLHFTEAPEPHVCTASHTVEDGIERIAYLPGKPVLAEKHIHSGIHPSR